jgi:probable F420-dependent oxidoreductase
MGATSRIGFITGVFVLPQRQAAVVAKQAAELEILRPGALRLGIGVGWNEIEFEALGADFKNRGRIIDEQVDLLKRFWDDDLVEFEGTYHRVSGAGINPRPAKTIPIWVGGQSDAALRRCARIGDGWLPLPESLETLREQRDRLFAYAEAQGRNPQDIGMELFVNFMPRNKFGLHKTPDPHMVLPNDVDRWNAKLDDLKNFGGVTHASLLTMDYGFPSPEYHLEAIRIYAEAVDVRGLNSQ